MHIRTLRLNLRRWFDSDLIYLFFKHKIVVCAGIILTALVISACLSPWIAPQNPYDPLQLDLLNAEFPPLWLEGAQPHFLLGTDTQGRCLLSAILYGLRISVFIGFCAVLLQLALGITFGLLAGYYGGVLDQILMRLADIQLSFSTLMVAIIVSALFKAILGTDVYSQYAMLMLIVVIGFAEWPQYARTVRACVLKEKVKEYVQASHVMRFSSIYIMFRHILPNCLSPLTVIATLQVANAVMSEAALSFLGLGMPSNQPSLGSLIQNGFEVIFSDAWWMLLFPSIVLVLFILTLNMLGDWLRDLTDPQSELNQ